MVGISSAGLVFVTASPLTFPVAYAGDPPSVSERVDIASAVQAASRQKTRVLITGETTVDSQTWANPDGTLTSEISNGPVRFLDDQGWRDLDLSLVEANSGNFSPEAFPEEIVLAGGKPQRIGTYGILAWERVDQGVIFWESHGALSPFNDAGFAYLPNGPSDGLQNGSFEDPHFRSLGGSWYAWTASW